MQTTLVQITDSEWTLLGNSGTMVFDIKRSGPVHVHIASGNNEPSMDAPFFIVHSWPAGFDFAFFGVSTSPRVWVRSASGPGEIVVAQ